MSSSIHFNNQLQWVPISSIESNFSCNSSLWRAARGRQTKTIHCTEISLLLNESFFIHNRGTLISNDVQKQVTYVLINKLSTNYYLSNDLCRLFIQNIFNVLPPIFHTALAYTFAVLWTWYLLQTVATNGFLFHILVQDWLNLQLKFSMGWDGQLYTNPP